MAAGLERHGLGMASVAVGLLVLVACREKPVDQAAVLRAHGFGAMYLQEGRLDEAEGEFRRVVELAPWMSAGHANLGLVAMKRGRYREAESHLRRAVKRDTADAEAPLLLAELYVLTGRRGAARKQLDALLARNPDEVRALHALVRFALDSAEGAGARRLELLERIVGLEPANLAARFELAVALLEERNADGAVGQLEELERQQPVPPQEAVGFFTRALGALRSGRLGEARTALARFERFIETTIEYQAGVRAIRGPGTGLPGVPALRFSPIAPPGLPRDSAIHEVLRFQDATAAAGLTGAADSAGVLALGDFNADGVEDLFVARRPPGSTGSAVLLRNNLGRFADSVGAGLTWPREPTAAAAADYDNDGRIDLIVAAADGIHLFRARENGTLGEVRAPGLTPVAGVGTLLLADLDHDGDLDIFAGGSEGARVYRNNMDGTFRDISAEAGLRGGAIRDAAIGDFDGDGRIDLVAVTAGGAVALYRNQGEHRFREVAAESGLAPSDQAAAVVSGDFDNDGFLDLFIAGLGRAGSRLYHNSGDGSFTRDAGSDSVLHAAAFEGRRSAAALDYDNDGYLDLIVAGPASVGSRGLFLFRNTGAGRFEDRSGIVPGDARGGGKIFATDYDQDGDQDLLVGGVPGLRLLRNDGGNLNRYVQVRLTALNTGSGKNNTAGIGARVEVRAGDLYQMRIVTGSVTQFGIGQQVGADVLRITWPNGVPQTLARGFSAAVVEETVLKGSCAFLYAWDGASYRFVTDVMWRSALGMPLGIMGGSDHGRTYAPPGASREYLRLPALQPKDGRYTVQLTEELWETAYVDELKLLVVDHPDSVDVYVDEKFVPPGPTPLRIYQVARAGPPAAATDGEGNDLRTLLAATDDRYVSNFQVSRYQGLTEPHDLLLDLGDRVAQGGPLLLLGGWIFPTDASINIALSQSSSLQAYPPVLEAKDGAGRWRTVIPDLGFPSGKRKTVVADLRGKLRPGERQVRIRTNMQIYWDRALLADEVRGSPVRITPLTPRAADLHDRGFSREFRKGGRYGPHWFDYGDVSSEPRWRPIEGKFTRYGEVGPLLGREDDMYVVMGPGDETTVEFEAAALPELPAGWRRDFLLYSVGWIKDSDLNTARGTTVEPLPFHAMSRYPYGPDESYPGDEAHRRFVETYLTREVSRARPTDLSRSRAR